MSPSPYTVNSAGILVDANGNPVILGDVNATVTPTGGTISGGGTPSTVLAPGQTAVYNPTTGTFTASSTLPTWLPWALGGFGLLILVMAMSGGRR